MEKSIYVTEQTVMRFEKIDKKTGKIVGIKSIDNIIRKKFKSLDDLRDDYPDVYNQILFDQKQSKVVV